MTWKACSKACAWQHLRAHPLKAALRFDCHRGQTQCRQIDAAQRTGRPEDQHHLAQGQTHATASPHAHPSATQFVFVIHRVPDPHNNALNRSLNKTVLGAVGDVDRFCSWSRRHVQPGRCQGAGAAEQRHSHRAGGEQARSGHPPADIAPWLQEMQQRHAFAEFVPMSPRTRRTLNAC